MKIDIRNLTKRVGDTGDFISIDQEKCTGCRRCVVVCIVNLWRMKKGTAYLATEYQEKCLECAACYSVCESDAISFCYPKGGTGIIYERG